MLQQAWSQPRSCTFKGYLQHLHTLPAQTRTNCFAIELLHHSQCPKLLKIKRLYNIHSRAAQLNLAAMTVLPLCQG